MIGYFFVADVLGFSNIVRNSNNVDLVDRIKKWTTLVDSLAEQHGIDNIQLISDTIFAYTDSSSDGLKKMIEFSRSLLNQGVPQSLPIRGAITHGEFEWGRLTYGKAIIDAHELETNQNWIGVSCGHPLPHIKDHWGFESLIVYPTPLKSGDMRLYTVVDWSVPPAKELSKYLTGGGLTHKEEVIQWPLGDKLNNTIQFSVYKSLIRQSSGLPNHYYGGYSMEVIEHLIRAPSKLNK